MYEHITVAQANLLDPSVCPALIDLTLLQCLKQSRPVYIELPTDMVSAMVDSSSLVSRITQFEPLSEPFLHEHSTINAVLECIYTSKQPAILIDGESWSYGILDELRELCRITQWPTWTSVFGKSLIDESLFNVHGIWKGPIWADQEHREYMDGSDLVLCFGPHFSSTNTYGYSTIPDYGKSIMFTASGVNIRRSTFRNVPMRAFMRRLLHTLDPSKIAHPPQPATKCSSFSNEKLCPDGALRQRSFFLEFNKYLRPGDVILAETGTAGHGCRDFKLPPNTCLIKPATWLSIGYMLPATEGAALAQRDSCKTSLHHQRTILLIGDGSFQMTAQELSTIIREELNVVIVLINNSGYTIERCLHGWDRSYNSIASWRYLNGPSFFGANESGDGYVAEVHRAETWSELWSALERTQGSDRSTLKMIEVVMATDDAPITLLRSLHEQKDGNS
jgi:pyruvate decarboxylase